MKMSCTKFGKVFALIIALVMVATFTVASVGADSFEDMVTGNSNNAPSSGGNSASGSVRCPAGASKCVNECVARWGEEITEIDPETGVSELLYIYVCTEDCAPCGATSSAKLSRVFNSIIGYETDSYGNFIRIAGLREFFLIVFAALTMGVVMSLLYRMVTKQVRKQGKSVAAGSPSQNLAITLVILPVVIAAVVFLVGNNLAAAFSLAGVFSITRFRSAAANSKDLTFIFVSMAIGLANGTGFVAYGAAITVVLCVVLMALCMGGYGDTKTVAKILRINVPESLSYDGLFDPVLQKYADSWEIARVKTVDLGSVYEISYSIAIKEGINEKELIDELRIRNGNLNIILVLDRRALGRNEM